MPLPTLGGQRHYVLGLSIRASVGPSVCMNLVNRIMPEGNSLKFGGSVDYDMTMKSIDFGFHRSKVKVTTKPNMKKEFSYGAITPLKCIRQQLLSLEKTYWGSVKRF